MPSRHNTPCHRHGNRAVANTTRYPEGGTSRTLTGPEGTRGLAEGAGRAGGERSKERASQAEATPHTKSKDEQSNRGRDNSNNQRPTGTRNTMKTPQRKHTDQKNTGHKGTIRAGRTNNRPQDTGPSTPPGKRQRTRKTPRRHRPTSQPQRQEAKRNTTTKRNELRSTSAPAQSADRHTSTKRIKIYLCGGRTEAKVRVYLSSLRACRQACTQVQKRSRP